MTPKGGFRDKKKKQLAEALRKRYLVCASEAYPFCGITAGISTEMATKRLPFPFVLFAEKGVKRWGRRGRGRLPGTSRQRLL